MFMQSASAFRGREYWLTLKTEYLPEGKTGLAIFPSSDYKLNHIAVQLLPEYLQKKALQKVIAVTDQDIVAEDLKRIKNEAVFVFRTDQVHITDLLNYYRLVQFIPRIVVVSTEDPFGNASIIGKAGIRMEDYIRNAIYV